MQHNGTSTVQKKPPKPFHEAVADRLIEQLSKGTAPWQKPWSPGRESLPHNCHTGQRYKGLNAIWLMAQGRPDSRWMTYRQALEMGAQVRSNEHGTTIQYWKFEQNRSQKDDLGEVMKDGEGKTLFETTRLQRPRAYYSTVFNADQIEGLPDFEIERRSLWASIVRAENILRSTSARIFHRSGDAAYYNPIEDFIVLPQKIQFEVGSGYYATALHELSHWSGHPSRLDRELSFPFGSEGYAKEELRAEIASMILGADIGTGHDPNRHAAYVGSWIRVIRDDPKILMKACADAEKIVKFILNFEVR